MSTELCKGDPDSVRKIASTSVLTLTACGLLIPLSIQAQVTPSSEEKNAQEGGARLEEIIITGTRIMSDGFNAPTPTSVISAEQLTANAQPNIFTTVAQLPSLQGSTGTQTNTFSTSSGQQGLSSFSLRGLGPIRTLTLLDGQRVVGANVTGVPDVSLFPQLLIERVDVVNGGASSSYGSDAVGGVVNFVTNTRFEGIKGNVQGAMTNYDDDETIVAQVAAGSSFLEDRLHVVGSVEYHDEKGVGPGEYGLRLAGGRDWFTQRTLVNRNVLNDGSPQYQVIDYAQPYNYTKYGLITAGPLQGIAFDEAGNPFQFEYGSNGVPARNAAGAVNGCLPGFCIGGDLSGNVDAGRTLQSELERINGYGRVGFEFADDDEIYVTANLAQVETHNQPINGMNRPNLTIQCSNPYLPASIQAACATAGITNFQYGTSNAILPSTQVYTDRRQYRFVLGALGGVSMFGNDWNYNGYYEHGVNFSDVDVEQIMLSRRFNQAIQAATLNGSIVCSDPVARASGCIPVNIFGGSRLTAEQLAYIMPANGPYQRTRQNQEVASFNISGSPVDLWAGPLALAFGVEYRKEEYRVRADAYGNGILPQAGIDGTPYSAEFPADPVLLDTGNNWYAGNYKNGEGEYSVKEAYFEFDLPLFKSESVGRANLNAASRVTDYSTSGTIDVWKLGGTWDTPVDGLRLRATTSRDARAPNLSELFAAPVTTTLPNFLDPFRNINVLAIQNVVGNVELTPEIARNTSFGVVLSQPSWLPNFNVSVDYYKIEIDDVISTLTAADIVNYCFRGTLPQTCNAFNLNNQSGPNFINVQSFNFASIETDGFDIEASYRWPQLFGLADTFTLRGLATHIREYVTDSGLPGTAPNDTAGVNIGATPDWKVLAIQSYETEKFSFQIQERWISDGVLGNQYIECRPGTCPVSTVTRPTIDNNHVDGAFYLDIGGTYEVLPGATAYFKVDNVLDEDPARVTIFSNPALYDALGRVYRLGVRFDL
ncbi:MAG TPA: TonB-dependent receptor [Steroidobacteraceae bacterium]|nr:TonB-dependent receptor [Steroidobacteraceae bacterium]